MENPLEIRSHENDDVVDCTRNNSPNQKVINYNVSCFRRISSQILAGSAKNLLLLDLGAIIGYQTIIIGNLLDAASQPSFTDEEASWFASLLFIGQPIGCLLAALILEPIGRKKAMIILNVPLFIGWLIISTTQSVFLLYVASFFLGLGAGFMESPTYTYIGEITEPQVRGIMTSFSELFFGVGSMVVNILGVWYDWQAIAYLCTTLPLISAIAITLIPESPIWLLAHKRTEEAERALCWLRGWVTPKNIEKEFSELVSYNSSKISKHKKISNLLESSEETFINKHGNESVTNTSFQGNDENDKEDQIQNFTISSESKMLNPTGERNARVKHLISDLLEPTMLHALLLMLAFFFFQIASGPSVVTAYTIPVFKELGFNLEPFRANVVSSAAGILGTVTLMAVVYFLGKRKIALFSTLGSAILCIAIGVYAFYPNSISADGYWSFPFVIYIVNNYIYGFGLGTLPWMYLSEIFPFRGRGVATGISAAMNYIFGFIVRKTFFTIKNVITLAGVFFLYGMISVVGFIFLYFLLPETEGRSLQDIEDNQRKVLKKPEKINIT